MAYKMFAIAGGFYIFGEEVPPPVPGYVSCKNAAMSGGFGGGKGIPGVCRGDKDATINLDRFAPDEELHFPLTAVYAIMPCIDLYKSKIATLR